MNISDISIVDSIYFEKAIETICCHIINNLLKDMYAAHVRLSEC